MKSKSKYIVVTGASTGIGYEFCASLLKRGYKVFGSVRNEKDGARLKENLGEDFTPLLFDVTDDEAIEKAGAQVADIVGEEGIGVLINNAGIAVGGPLLHIKMDKIRQQFDVNVLGLIKCTQVFAPLLGARENHSSVPGRVLNISSVAGKVGMPFIAPYVGSKHAVEGISHSLRRELLLYGIDVIIIGPGAVKTPIWEKSINMDEYHATPFGNAIKRFNNVLVKRSIDAGFSPQYLGEFVAKIVEKDKPKTRYAIVPQKITNWLMPQILPDRMVDAFLAKSLKMNKK